MEFPELRYGQGKELEVASISIQQVLESSSYALRNEFFHKGQELLSLYEKIEPHLTWLVKNVCSSCSTPCCVNRHCYPEYEDLIVHKAMKVDTVITNWSGGDTDPCCFLSKEGCTLPRVSRSYRCTWYVCDRAMDVLHTLSKKRALKLERLLHELGLKRQEVLKTYEIIFKNYERRS